MWIRRVGLRGLKGLMKFGEAESKVVIQPQPDSFSQTTSDLTPEGLGVGLRVPPEGRGGVLGVAGVERVTRSSVWFPRR